jgi:hypothetical protein
MEYNVNGALSLIDELRNDARIGKNKHFNASRRKIGKHNWLGIPVVLINVALGTIIVSLLSDGNEKSAVVIVSTIFAYIAASLSALQTFFNYHKAAEGHSSIGNRYLKISRECKALLRKHQDIPYVPEELWKEVKKIQDEYLDINTEAEAFPTSDKDLLKATSASEVTPFDMNGE